MPCLLLQFNCVKVGNATLELSPLRDTTDHRGINQIATAVFYHALHDSQCNHNTELGLSGFRHCTAAGQRAKIRKPCRALTGSMLPSGCVFMRSTVCKTSCGSLDMSSLECQCFSLLRQAPDTVMHFSHKIDRSRNNLGHVCCICPKLCVQHSPIVLIQHCRNDCLVKQRTPIKHCTLTG